MDATGGFFYLESGKWRGRVVAQSSQEVLELVDLLNPVNKMRVSLPFSWRQLSKEKLTEFARRPEVRLWMDRSGVMWRVTAVGPDTAFDYPLRARHLVFDSQQSWAGIVAFPLPRELGDLTYDELCELRDTISDFGGQRRRYRAPA